MTSAALPSLSARLELESPMVRRTLEVLGELLGATSASRRESAEGYLERMMACAPSSLAVESKVISSAFVVAVGSVLADLIADHNPDLGPGEYANPPSWSQATIGGEVHSYPDSVSAFFPAGTLGETPLLVRVAEHPHYNDRSMVWVFAAAGERICARSALDRILESARRDKNFYRGKVLHAASDRGLAFSVVDVPGGTRTDLVLPDKVWAELDTNVSAVTTRANLLRAMGLGTRRGVLIAGPPGVGKSAVCRLIGSELVGDFTVIIVDARAASGVLREVYRETAELGPTVVILEDVDLYIGNRDRGNGGTTLADFLAVMDGTEQYDDVLTLASTNDPAALDKAAVRSARFDAVIHLDYPDRTACARILGRYLAALPAADEIDLPAVARDLPEEVSGADVREIIRLSVLQHGTELTTASLRRTIQDGRWKPAPLVGNYL